MGDTRCLTAIASPVKRVRAAAGLHAGRTTPAERLPVTVDVPAGEMVRLNLDMGHIVSGRVKQAGYTVVTQDVRGRYGSEGTFNPHVQETDDGFDAFAWAAAQLWSNGVVGTLFRQKSSAASLAVRSR